MSSLFNLATATAAGGHRNRSGYNISRSVRLRGSASAYLNRTPGSAGNRKTWTWSGWVKRGTVSPRVALFGFGTSAAGGGPGGAVYFDSNTIHVVSGGGTATFLSTTPVYRDPSAWYHIVIAFDSTQATASNRVKIYVNGLQVTALANTTYPSQNYDSDYNNTIAQYIGVRGDGGLDSYFDGYLTEINSIDGQALTPSSFGETNPFTGVWRPKKYTGTYGTNGFYLNFSDNSAATAAAIGKDSSGNGNNWTPNNISVTNDSTYDSMLDVPTQYIDGGNGRGNYAVMNPLDVISGTNAPTYSNGNLTLAVGNANYKSRGTIGASSGKYYFEFGGTNVGGIYNTIVVTGIINEAGTDWRYQVYDGNKINSGSSTAYGTGYGSGAWPTIGCAIDLDNGKIWFRNDSGWYASGDPAAGTNAAFTNVTGTVRPYFEGGGGGYSGTIQFNFGQRPFTYTPPAGFKALNTLNLPTPTILKGNQYFDTILWSGDGVNGRAITANVGTVDFAWVKKRNGIDDHRLANSVTGGNKHLKSNTTEAEQTGTTVIQAFGGNTFTVGSDNSVNASGGTYVGWTWQKGATQGFDIVTFTGDGSSPKNISHSLGVAPKMIIIKSRNNVSGWNSYHASLGNTQQINLQTTAAAVTSIDWWNNTSPTSSQFTIGANLNINTYTFVAYLFSEVAGFSKFGSYTGNGSADGPFVYTGFRPRFVLFKRTDSATGGEWAIYDSSRDRYNANTTELYPANSSADETAGGASMDFTSNGFKIRNSRLGINASGGTYIFAAFAETPFKNALAR